MLYSADDEDLPLDVKIILDSFNPDAEDFLAESARIQSDLNSIGWDCDYGFDGVVYDIQKQAKI